MFARMGRRKYVVPLLIGIVLALFMSLMFWPMMHMDPKNMPFAILSLDEGAETAAGDINAGDSVVDSLMESTESDDGEEPMIKWTEVGSQEELDEAFENGEYYGAIIIPEDFSEKEVAVQEAQISALMEQVQGLVESQVAAVQEQAAAAAAAAATESSDLAAAAGALSSGDVDLEALAEANGLDASALAGMSDDELAALAAAAGAEGSDDAAADAAAAAAAATESADDSAASGLDMSAIDMSSIDTEALMAAMNGEDLDVDAPTIQVILDYAKSPLIATQMQSTMGSMFSELGVDVDTELIHHGAEESDSDDDDDSSSGMMLTSSYGSMMGMQIAVMPLFMTSSITALILARILRIRHGDSRSRKWKRFGAQALIAFFASFIAAVCSYFMLIWVVGIDVEFAVTLPFTWLASFCIMLLFIGLYNVAFGLGVVFMACCMMFGMMSAMLPYEMFPTFWQDWVWPWAPQHYVAEGLRTAIYTDAGLWSTGTLAMVIMAAVGIVVGIIGVLIPGHKTSEIAEEQQAERYAKSIEAAKKDAEADKSATSDAEAAESATSAAEAVESEVGDKQTTESEANDKPTD